MSNTLRSVVHRWSESDSAITPTSAILSWIRDRNAETAVEIRKIPLEQCAPWFYDAKEKDY